MRHANVTLEDKYALDRGRVFITGVQALLRIMLDQGRRDEREGLKTAGFISGYRGSPLGGLDQQAARAAKTLAERHILFKEAINEDLGATAVWGTQQANLFPGRPLRRRLRPLVRQGARRRPHRRRLQARQLRRNLGQGRGAGGGRRRPRLQVVHPALPVGVRLPGLRDAGPGARRRPGGARLRPSRLRPVALLGPVGGADRPGRHHGFRGHHPRRSRAGRVRAAREFPPPVGRPAASG